MTKAKKIIELFKIIGYLICGIEFIYTPELISKSIIIIVGIYFLINAIFDIIDIIIDYKLNNEKKRLNNLKNNK